MTPLLIAAFQGNEQIVQILLEKGNPNVDFADQVLLLNFNFDSSGFFFFFISHVTIFDYLKNGVTPLLVAAQEGHEQIVEILLEKGNPNVDLADHQVFLLNFNFDSFSFFFLMLLFLIL